MNNEIFSSYQHYGYKGNRLSIYGWPVEGWGIQVFIFCCSKQDVFKKSHCKKMAMYLQEHGLEKFQKLFPKYHPVERGIPNNYKKHEFLEWCDNTWFKQKDLEIILPKGFYQLINSPTIKDRKFRKVLKTKILVKP